MTVTPAQLKTCTLDTEKTSYLKEGPAILRPIRYAIWMIRKNGTENQRAERKAVRELESAAAKVRSAHRNCKTTSFDNTKAEEEAITNFYLKFANRISFIPIENIPEDANGVMSLAAQLIYTCEDPAYQPLVESLSKYEPTSLELLHYIDNVYQEYANQEYANNSSAFFSKIESLCKEPEERMNPFHIFKRLHKFAVISAKKQGTNDDTFFLNTVKYLLKNKINNEIANLCNIMNSTVLQSERNQLQTQIHRLEAIQRPLFPPPSTPDRPIPLDTTESVHSATKQHDNE